MTSRRGLGAVVVDLRVLDARGVLVRVGTYLGPVWNYKHISQAPYQGYSPGEPCPFRQATACPSTLGHDTGTRQPRPARSTAHPGTARHIRDVDGSPQDSALAQDTLLGSPDYCSSTPPILPIPTNVSVDSTARSGNSRLCHGLYTA